jgi:hypothetical protein
MLKSIATIVAVVLLAVSAAPSARAQGDVYDVDLLLILAADVSRSMDEPKFRLQREGYASAITNRRVLNAIESGAHGRIAVMFFEWAGPGMQQVVIDWMIIANREDAEQMARTFRSAPRSFYDRTAIGSAIEFATARMASAPFRAPRKTIDVSGDGTNNAGRDVVVARQGAIEVGITINGIAILSDLPLITNPDHTHPPGGLLKYYEDNVIGGPGSFAIAAESFEAFGTALVSKLVKEIASAEPTQTRVQ